MQQDDRARFDRALRRVRASAYPSGEFVGQESFMRASEILSLAVAAGIGPGTSVLDLCCGVSGPGRFIAAEQRCRYLGVDASTAAIDIAKERAADPECRFQVSRIPPVPAGPFDVVLLLETMLAFPDKPALLREVSAALEPGGRFAFTLEEGPPLSEAEQGAMPDSDTVWLTPLPEMHTYLEQAGLKVRHQSECTRSHLEIVEALIDALAVDSSDLAALIGPRAVDDLLTAHRLWSNWMRSGRVRKFAVVAEALEKP